MTSDVNGFADEEKAGDGADFHGARLQTGGVYAAGRDLSLFKALCAGGMKGEVAQVVRAGGERGVAPAVGRGGFCEKGGQALRQHGAQSLAECGRIAWGAGLKQWREQIGVGGKAGSEINEDRLTGMPVGRGLQNGGAAQAAMRDEHLFAEARPAAWAAGPGFHFCGDSG